jgi:hypothetical protein
MRLTPLTLTPLLLLYTSQRGLLEIPTDVEAPRDWFFRETLAGVPSQLKRSYQIGRRRSASGADSEIIMLLEDLRSILTYEDEEEELADVPKAEIVQYLIEAVKHLDMRLLKELDEVS